ncbi:hypothetical protein [Brachybacterium squillarum]|nr:hypothetical protein [Brachybacterium squillarum]
MALTIGWMLLRTLALVLVLVRAGVEGLGARPGAGPGVTTGPT